MTAEQIRNLVKSLPDDSLCFREVTCGPWRGNRKTRREAQVSYALSEPRFGWIVAKTFGDHGLMAPAMVRIPAIRRANYHLLGWPDETAAWFSPARALRRA